MKNKRFNEETPKCMYTLVVVAADCNGCLERSHNGAVTNTNRVTSSFDQKVDFLISNTYFLLNARRSKVC